MHQRKKRKIIFWMHAVCGMLAACIGYFLAAGMKPGADLLSWFTAEQEMLEELPSSLFLEQHTNQYTLPVITGCLFLYGLYALIHFMENKDLMAGRTYGSAQLADPADINAKIMDKGRDSKGKKRPDSCFYYVDASGCYHEGRFHGWKLFWRNRKTEAEKKERKKRNKKSGKETGGMKHKRKA